MISKRTLLNALQKAQADALQLLFVEMKHHALCYRSIGTVPHYAQLLVSTLRLTALQMDQTAKGELAEGLQWVQINLERAETEIEAGYQSVIRRTIIVLADIVENLVESTIGICLLHLDPTQTSIREVTTFKRQAATERLLKQAVRAWESRLFADFPARTQRIEHMIKAFFPAFEKPQDFEVLDRLFIARNQFTHELIRLTEEDVAEALEPWSLPKVDQLFHVASDFLLAVMAAIP
jgi:hypothetical protein